MLQKSNKISSLLEVLDTISPFSLQESWDNSGLILGGKYREFSEIYLSLEVDQNILKEVKEGSVIISHHPLIFSPFKRFVDEIYPTNLLNLAIAKKISLIAMHTNFDKTHFGSFVARKIFGEKAEIFQEDFIVYVDFNGEFDKLCELIKKRLDVKTLKTTKTHSKIKKVALVTGSGASLMRSLTEDVDCFISGDFKYHEAMEALSYGMNLIDVGHFELERYFGEILKPILTNYGYKAIILDSQNPFNFV
ncbi:Nif3-like dinuclear metal center hexameric protein [Helicobacter burdigaliensis]|uniref:Nif3-like dinuclear metal center hexameric protein n=1 Tax=Helicobacter burdigaliensis TaxID=2315334 RepID=UPI000EF66256|nr:Nif3-like dinuclear metal center hexameric protein [Helicobacter burdigaliensis]